MEAYDTMVEAINALRKQGYTEDLNLKESCVECINKNIQLSPADFQVDKFFRFEDNTYPSDQAILYAISSSKYNLKGLLVNAYGMYADSVSNEIVEKLHVH